MKIGFIGFGELSYCFARGIDKTINIIAYDINIEEAKKRADILSNVKIVNSLEELLNETKYIFVAVTGQNDSDVFESIYDMSINDYLFIDLSSALPKCKEKISNNLEKKNAKYVDVAVLGSVPKLLHKTPMMASGNGTTELQSLASKLDMNITMCGGHPGKASTIKLCRSIFMKGLPALLIETKRVASKYNVENEVFASIYKNLDDQCFEEYTIRLIDGAYKHWKRQKEELEECAKIASDVGIDDDIIHSAIEIFDSLGETND